MAMLGRVPAIGDRATMGNVAIEVESMHGRRIGTVLVELVEPPAPAKAPKR